METALINGKRYTFVTGFKDDVLLRKNYNVLTQKTYGFDFEQWYQAGFWESGYIPYSLLDGKNIVSNVSTSIIDCLVLGKSKRYIQIGTVMTDSEYRNQGLSRYLMEKVIEEWQNKCDMLYLFANDSVLNFYPKFGFKAVCEYQYSKSVTNDNDILAAEKLDMSLDKSRKLLMEKVANSIPMSKIALLRNTGLIMFYCISFMSFMRDKVYYLKEHDAIVIAEFKGNTLYLQDIFSPSDVDLDNIINAITDKDVKKVVLGFTPNDTDSYSVNLLKEDNTTLFVMKEGEELFQNNKLMFPILSHT